MSTKSELRADELRRAKLRRLIHEKERVANPVNIAMRKALDASDAITKRSESPQSVNSSAHAFTRHAETMKELRAAMSKVRSKAPAAGAVTPTMPNENHVTGTISVTAVEEAEAKANLDAKTVIDVKVQPMNTAAFQTLVHPFTKGTSIEQKQQVVKEAKASAGPAAKKRGRRRYDSSSSDSDDETQVAGLSRVTFKLTKDATKDQVDNLLDKCRAAFKKFAAKLNRYNRGGPSVADADFTHDAEAGLVIGTFLTRVEDVDPLKEILQEFSYDLFNTNKHAFQQDLPSMFRHAEFKLELPNSVGKDFFGTPRGIFQMLRGGRLSYDIVMRHKGRRYLNEAIEMQLLELEDEDDLSMEGPDVAMMFARAAAVAGPRHTHIEAVLNQPEIIAANFVRSYSAKQRKYLQRHGQVESTAAGEALASTAVEEFFASKVSETFATNFRGDNLKDGVASMTVALQHDDPFGALAIPFAASGVVEDIVSAECVTHTSHIKATFQGLDVFQHLPPSLAAAKSINNVCFFAANYDEVAEDPDAEIDEEDTLCEGFHEWEEDQKENRDFAKALEKLWPAPARGGRFSWYGPDGPQTISQRPSPRNSVIRVVVLGAEGAGRKTLLRALGPAFVKGLKGVTSDASSAAPKPRHQDPNSSGSSCCSESDDSDDVKASGQPGGKALRFRVINMQVGDRTVLVHIPLTFKSASRADSLYHCQNADAIVVVESAKQQESQVAERSIVKGMLALDDSEAGSEKPHWQKALAAHKIPLMIVSTMGDTTPSEDWYKMVAFKEDIWSSVSTVHVADSSNARRDVIEAIIPKCNDRHKKVKLGTGPLSPWDFVHASVGDGCDEE